MGDGDHAPRRGRGLVALQHHDHESVAADHLRRRDFSDERASMFVRIRRRAISKATFCDRGPQINRVSMGSGRVKGLPGRTGKKFRSTPDRDFRFEWENPSAAKQKEGTVQERNHFPYSA